jgi:outer membrane protein OmpA-like peptidoglycan-associated protein
VKDSVDVQRVESNIIVSDDDYGLASARDGMTSFTVTASSATYGERSITIDVKDPGKTTNQDDTKVQTEIRKTITLGQRPKLGAEMEFSKWAKGKNNGFKGLVMEERATIQLYPLLPYVFFNLGDAAIPARYKQITGGQTADFNDERIPGGTLDKYYHVMNIYGYRLRKYPNVNVEVVGCLDETNEDKGSDLSKRRAQIVYDYLKNVWGISESRMKLSHRGWPEVRSNPKDSFGIVENRRTEFRFSGGTADDLWEVQRPILDNDPTVSPDPDRMTWTMANGIDENIVASRRIEILRNAQPWNTLTAVGTTDASTQWDWQNTDLEYPKEKGAEGAAEVGLNPFKAVLVVTSKNGQECKSDTVTVPVKRVSSKMMGTERGAEKTLEKYNLILFKFDSPEAGELNERIMSTWVFPRVKKSSDIRIEGHTDIVGLDTRNKKLSEDRARTAENFIKKRTSSFSSLQSRGTGEEEPLYSNELPEGRFFNRTVQVIIETPLADAEIGE